LGMEGQAWGSLEKSRDGGERERGRRRDRRRGELRREAR